MIDFPEWYTSEQFQEINEHRHEPIQEIFLLLSMNLVKTDQMRPAELQPTKRPSSLQNQ